MNPAYQPLLGQLRKPLVCPEHSRANCVDCSRQWIDRRTSRLIAGCEELLRKTASEDARYLADDVDNEE